MVTQIERGEVAVIDMTNRIVLDEDPTVPGTEFLPVARCRCRSPRHPEEASTFRCDHRTRKGGHFRAADLVRRRARCESTAAGSYPVECLQAPGPTRKNDHFCRTIRSTRTGNSDALAMVTGYQMSIRSRARIARRIGMQINESHRRGGESS